MNKYYSNWKLLKMIENDKKKKKELKLFDSLTGSHRSLGCWLLLKRINLSGLLFAQWKCCLLIYLVLPSITITFFGLLSHWCRLESIIDVTPATHYHRIIVPSPFRSTLTISFDLFLWVDLFYSFGLFHSFDFLNLFLQLIWFFKIESIYSIDFIDFISLINSNWFYRFYLFNWFYFLN